MRRSCRADLHGSGGRARWPEAPFTPARRAPSAVMTETWMPGPVVVARMMTRLARSLSPVMEEVSAFATCGPAANTASVRQTAVTAQSSGEPVVRPTRRHGPDLP